MSEMTVERIQRAQISQTSLLEVGLTETRQTVCGPTLLFNGLDLYRVNASLTSPVVIHHFTGMFCTQPVQEHLFNGDSSEIH